VYIPLVYFSSESVPLLFTWFFCPFFLNECVFMMLYRLMSLRIMWAAFVWVADISAIF